MLARIPLIPIVVLLSFVSLLLTVLLLVGAPLAGGMSAVVALVMATLLTLPMAFVFAHGEGGHAGH